MLLPEELSGLPVISGDILTDQALLGILEGDLEPLEVVHFLHEKSHLLIAYLLSLDICNPNLRLPSPGVIYRKAVVLNTIKHNKFSETIVWQNQDYPNIFIQTEIHNQKIIAFNTFLAMGVQAASAFKESLNQG